MARNILTIPNLNLDNRIKCSKSNEVTININSVISLLTPLGNLKQYDNIKKLIAVVVYITAKSILRV